MLAAPICAALSAALLQGDPRPLPKAEATKLRELFAEALAEPQGPARRKLLAHARKLEQRHRFEDLLAALREGPKLPRGAQKPRKVGGKREALEDHGGTVVGYQFESGGDLHRYAVNLPEGYDQDRAWPLLLDPGHGTGKDQDDRGKADFVPFWRNMAERAELPCIVVRTEVIEQVGTDGMRGAQPEDRVAGALLDCVRDVASRFSVDPDRVYASGLSQTGYWAWYLARARPDRWAGIAPMSAVTWQVKDYLPNLVLVPIHVLHGDADAVCPVAQPRATCKALRELGARTEYLEVAGAGHDGAVWGRLPQALDWLEGQERARYPRSVTAALSTTRTPWFWWLRVDALEREGEGLDTSAPSGTLAAEVEGRTVRLTTRGIARVTLCLASELLDLDQPVEVVWNGEQVHAGPVPRSFEGAVEVALDKADWSATCEALLPLKAP